MSWTRVIIIGLFILGASFFALLGLLSRREHSKIPSLADLAGFVMEYRVGRLPVGRVAVYGFWWWLGWHFFAR
jgi:Family of unknown function (DUF6186)